MKKIKLVLTTTFLPVLQLVCLVIGSLLTGSCDELNPSGYILELPNTPDTWVSLLGEPYWRIEWITPDNIKQVLNIQPHEKAKIDIPVTWANPVTAWPYWPSHDLIPGFFKPAGAIFPFDAKDGFLYLSWKTGPDTILYWELLNANEDKNSRVPANFDWLRFRELFNTDMLKEAVREDPWLVNWRSVAEKTVSGNFDTRRLVSEAAVQLIVPVSSGPWYGSSPFTKPLFFEEGEPSIFPIRPGINVWISSSGILRVNGETWVFTGSQK
ncbi:MAG: hypothetical protein FWC06_05745 [Treponema sp.]|nr:hypothetical protein [Treponema sp.]